MSIDLFDYDDDLIDLYMQNRKKRKRILQRELFEPSSSRKVLNSQGILLSALLISESQLDGNGNGNGNGNSKDSGHPIVEMVKEKSDVEFFEFCRVTKETFYLLIDKLSRHPSCKEGNSGKKRLAADLSLMVFLWYLGRQCTYTNVAEVFGLSFCSTHRLVQKITAAINDIYKDVIQWPTEQNIVNFEKDFKNICNFPGVIGSVDVCHINIRTPAKVVHEHFADRTMNNCVNLLAVCDANKKFTYVNVGYPGCSNAQQILDNSILGIQLRTDGNSVCFNDSYHLVGGSAYQLETHMMVPFTGILNVHKIKYNSKLLMTRQGINRAFALLKSRFKHLQYFDSELEKVAGMVTAACILHNITRDSKKERDSLESEVIEGVEMHVNIPLNPFQDSDEGIQKRNRIMKML